MMKKTLFTLVVDAYPPEICALTFPLLQAFAEKCRAGFRVITERRWPQFSPRYEKLQIHELGREMGNDWNIYFDADALVHPDAFDPTEHIGKDTVLHNGRDMSGNRFLYDDYFRRDGRHIGSGNWFTVASDWCLDLWKAHDDLTYEQCVRNIRPTLYELQHGVEPENLVDDYTLSRNIARYGLKFISYGDLIAKLDRVGDEYFWHQYTISAEEKARQMRETLCRWGLGECHLENAVRIEGRMSVAELYWLGLQAKKRRKIAEVGAWRGRTTRALADNTLGTVTVVDTWLGSPEQKAELPPEQLFSDFRQNLGDRIGKTVFPLRSSSMDAARTLRERGETFDFVFVDADHAYESVRADIEAWRPLVSAGGVLAGHDYQPGIWPGVVRAVDETLPDRRLEVGTIWWREIGA